jgi:integrase
MSKRGNAEGTIYQRNSDGRWAAALTTAEGGRRHFYGKTRREVAGKLRTAQQAVVEGRPIPSERLTVGQYLDRWLAGARATIRPNTHAGYERVVRLHLKPHLGSLALARLSAPDIAACYDQLLESGLSPRSVQLAHAVLHRALRQGERWGLVARNVADLVDAPRVERREVDMLNPDEIRRLLAAAAGDPHEALITVAVTTGLRWGELAGLRWADVSFEDASLAVRQQAQRTDAGWAFVPPKTASGRRSVTLPAFAVDALRRHRIGQNEHRLALGAAWDDLDLVFPNELGRPRERQNFGRRDFARLLAKAELRHVKFHALRHSAATLLLAEGVHIRAIQERLGHSDVRLTLAVYSHVLPTLQREAAQTLERTLGG